MRLSEQVAVGDPALPLGQGPALEATPSATAVRRSSNRCCGLLGRDMLRVLRILALFACPSVDHHPAVYQHAARPLMGDARNVVSDGTRQQVGTLFAAWWRRRAPEAAA